MRTIRLEHFYTEKFEHRILWRPSTETVRSAGVQQDADTILKGELW